MRELTLLLKPASGQCNARCAYCFYQDVTQKRNQASCGMMTVATLEIILRKALRQAEKGCTIIYQGGEPSLRGLSFYQKAVELQKQHYQRGVSIRNVFQTNGLASTAGGRNFCGAPFSGGRFFRWNTQNSRRLPCGCKRQGHVSPGDGYDLPFQKIPGGF